MIETKDVVGWLLAIAPLLFTYSYNRSKKGRLKIAIDYVRQKTISNEPRAVVDLPKVEQNIDPLLVEITLTNTGKETVLVDKFGVTVDGKNIVLEYCTPFYFTSTAPNAPVHGGFSELQYISKTGEKLGKIEGQHKVQIQMKASLFLHDVKDIFVIDTLSNKWSADKKSLDKFYIEFNQNNPAPYSRGGDVPIFFEFKKNNLVQPPSVRGWDVAMSQFFKEYRSEIVSAIIGIVLLTGTPWWWNWFFGSKPVKEEQNRPVAIQSIVNQPSQPNPSNQPTVTPTNPINSTNSIPPKPVPKKKEEIVMVNRGTTGTLFDGAVRVSVIGISFEGSPLRDKVSAKIDGFGLSEVIEKADVGTLVTLKKGETAYEVRLHSVSTSNAEFSGIIREDF
ncbi:hypothetical protein [Propionispora vibrioides]|uniref:Uncharacterized protein n=1 Tax=Propionispora vibrioides TaxID=112903 RepID=A0A1H8SIP0_9FIRM|nr:hypothetical protein [Propionispora vibrioides]SEO78435.1 hypothetical protein SAMN04490178_10577 [Propionispora vibrioides]